jgi:hypothetical protein
VGVRIMRPKTVIYSAVSPVEETPARVVNG